MTEPHHAQGEDLAKQANQLGERFEWNETKWLLSGISPANDFLGPVIAATPRMLPRFGTLYPGFRFKAMSPLFFILGSIVVSS